MLESSKKSAEEYRNPPWIGEITENEWNETFPEVEDVFDKPEVYKFYMVRIYLKWYWRTCECKGLDRENIEMYLSLNRG